MCLRNRIALPALMAWMLFACSEPACAVDIEQVLWGYDGRATPNCFNLISILISNPTPEPFNGVFELREENGAGGRIGAVERADVYVAQFSSRWMQFYPYVKSELDEWRLKWGQRRGEEFEIPQPRMGEQSPVLLVEPGEVQGRGDALKHFSADLFPPMVTATDALTHVILDHAPRWEESRRQAFLDWLYRGGRLHLIKGVNGEYPKFSAGLAELNAPLDKFRFGAGEIVRHDRQRSQLDRQFVDSAISSTGDAAQHSAASDDAKHDADDSPEFSPPARSYPGRRDANVLFADFAGGIMSSLKSLTRPNHSWALIYSLALLYILAIFPGLYLLGRKRTDYRVVYGALFGVLVVFSLGFAHVGRRGYGESTGVDTLAVARQLPNGALDVTAWSNVFVIDGDLYNISHAGTGRLYSAAESFEAVRGEINNGPAGRFQVDIPPYSSRPFMHRLKLKQDPFEFQVQEISADKDLSKLVLVIGENFPRPANSNSVYALYRNSLYPMIFELNTLKLGSGRGEPLASFFNSIDSDEFETYGFGNPFVGRIEAAEKVRATLVYQRLFPPLVAWSLGLTRRDQIPTFVLPDDRVRLLLAADLPASMQIDVAELGSQRGRVLYVLDLPKPVTP